MIITNCSLFQDDDERLYGFITCFGEYDCESNMCTRNCGVSIRCAIEHDQQAKDELLQELFDVDSALQVMQ